MISPSILSICDGRSYLIRAISTALKVTFFVNGNMGNLPWDRIPFANLDKPPEWRDALPGSDQAFVGYGVQDHVHTLTVRHSFDTLRKRCISTVKDMIVWDVVRGHHQVLLLVRANGDIYFCAKVLRNLDRSLAVPPAAE